MADFSLLVSSLRCGPAVSKGRPTWLSLHLERTPSASLRTAGCIVGMEADENLRNPGGSTNNIGLAAGSRML